MITERHINMVHPDGFDCLFEKEITKHKTYEDAFNALNKEYEEAFGQLRYSNYDSYRKARGRRIKV